MTRVALALTTLGIMPAAHAGFVADLGVVGPVSTSFGSDYDPSRKHFNDHYTFSIGGASGGTLALRLWGVNMDSLSVKLKGAGQPVSSLPNGLSFEGLGAGLYDLQLKGDVGPHGGSYQGTIQTIASAAPEPEVWLMMVLGLAGVGYAARRRKAS